MARRRRLGKRTIQGLTTDPVEALRRRAQRHARRGNLRKATVAMQQVAALDEQAKSYVALGELLRRAQRPGEALWALKQGQWLHRRAGKDRRARTVGTLILALEPAAGTA